MKAIKLYRGTDQLNLIAAEIFAHEMQDHTRAQLVHTVMDQTANEPEAAFSAGFTFGVEAALKAIESGSLRLARADDSLNN
jgi:hypothetical protein